MSGINLVILVGNLGGDPEIRYGPSGVAIANFTVATTEKWKDKNSGQQQEATEWHRIVFFGRQAEIAQQYLHKGDKVYVEGSLKTNKWQDNDGNPRQSTEIRGRKFQMMGAPRQPGDSQGYQPPQQRYQAPQQGQQGQQGGQQQRPAQQGSGNAQQQHYSGPPSTDFDDDIPF